MDRTEPPVPLPIGEEFAESGIDFPEMWRRLASGMSRTVGLALVGLVLACIIGFLGLRSVPEPVSMRLSFAFPGFEKGEYPDGSNFLADDIRAPDVIAEALLRRPMAGMDKSLIRSSIEVLGVVPLGILKERERIRATGQTPPLYMPDEYTVTLSARGVNPLTTSLREDFLTELVNCYSDRFRRTYAESPPQFGKAFESLGGADYFEYEIILRQDIQSLRNFLAILANQADIASDRKSFRTAAATFRSSTTGYSFNDLLGQVDYFSQIKLNETLGLIQSSALSKNRDLALLKMEYRLRILGEEEKRLNEGESVVRDLMEKVNTRSQSYVLGVKSQMNTSRADGALIDQGLLDSLVQNDSYSFLVRRALDVGTRARELTAQKEALLERRDGMLKFTEKNAVAQASARENVDQSLIVLKADYSRILEKVQQTYADYSRQQFAGAVRVIQPPTADKLSSKMLSFAVIGAVLGLLFGMGLSLIGFFTRRA